MDFPASLQDAVVQILQNPGLKSEALDYGAFSTGFVYKTQGAGPGLPWFVPLGLVED